MQYGAIKPATDAAGVQQDAPRSSSKVADNADAGPEAAGLGQQPRDAADADGDKQRRRGVRGRLRAFYERNIGLFFVFLAQTFGSIMSTAAKLLTSSGGPNRFHALHIIFVRMAATAVLGFLYMWHQRVPDFPFGSRDIRGLLLLRGLAGFVGLFGLYYSLTYLDFADSTVISFLIPILTAVVCYVWLREPYTIREALAGLIALAGVLLVARPPFLFPRIVAGPNKAVSDGVGSLVVEHPHGLVPAPPASPAQRGFAVVCGVLGTFAAAVAYTTIRVIGKRAHSLISVNYFALVATIGSALIILVHPDLKFLLPQGAMQWTLLTVIGIAGFMLQFLLTEGLKREKAGRATNMIYIQMVFALVVERVVWGTTPPPLSLIGAVLIIGAAIWLSLQKNHPPVAQQKPVADEESSLLGSQGDGSLRT
ncbi:hypothetical protein DL764_008991 [Monosporascus ibericus]|uniref:EamA domain-containing protein n=1 Tax=Monosporascus ibericus TaxID=155417 RepID=A0A4V1X939_9PEZI|nr:hypothetical protein DL764_008991 [Monosporascus ibericus]